MFRPYLTAPRNNLSERLQYKDHLKAIKKPRKRIDNQAPALPSNNYVKAGTLENDAVRLAQVENENRQLISRLNVIGRTKGKIDNLPPAALKTSNYRARKRKNKRIEILNFQLYCNMQNLQSNYKKEAFLQDYERRKKQLIKNQNQLLYEARREIEESWSIAPKKIDERLLDPRKRARCYFDVGVKGEKKFGRIVMEIWTDIAPVTGCNFINLCKGYNGYSYKNTPFHRIVKEIFCVGGDVVNKSGTGIYSVYGGINKTYTDENTILEFNGPGVLAAHTIFSGDNHSQFLITFRKMVSMNDHFVVFGQIIGNFRPLELIQSYGTEGGGPIKEVIISDCGVIDGIVPDPKTIMLPPRISPKTSKNELHIYRKKEKPVTALDKTSRRKIIKQSRELMKSIDVPCYKLNVSRKNKKASKKLKKSKKKKKSRNKFNMPRPLKLICKKNMKKVK